MSCCVAAKYGGRTLREACAKYGGRSPSPEEVALFHAQESLVSSEETYVFALKGSFESSTSAATEAEGYPA
ncbi:MAG: hypothetical protein H6727_09335 [Myxococcales bacterium]|nr:hypothetical protein [Myxococcales bacterium]